MMDKFSESYLAEIKAEWKLLSGGIPWWQQCQCETSSPVYDLSYDAHYCLNCLSWLSAKCSDENCSYCGDRPDFFNGSKPFYLICVSTT